MGSVPAFSVESKTLRDVMRFSSKHADDVARGVGGSGEVRQLVPHQLSDSEKKFYKRPSGYRKNAKETVWDKAKDEQGVVKDPITKKVMDIEEPWDMGHKPGHEFRKHQQSAADRKITRKQFLDEYNNPNSYRPELPESNRSHIGEDKTDFYFCP